MTINKFYGMVGAEMFEAMIFDMDDTLVASISLHFEAYRRVLLETGIVITEQEYRASIGGIASELIPKLLNGRTCSISTKEIHTRKINTFLSMIETEELQLLETAKLLPIFFGKYKLAIGSAGSGVQVHRMIDRLGIRKYFDVIIVGEDVKYGKPAPDAFLLASKLMNVPPEKCFVFGDSLADFQASEAAGMKWFDVKRTVI
jgi:beta-phosphoglucomutase-like phosphatase (HAD superfamily)